MGTIGKIGGFLDLIAAFIILVKLVFFYIAGDFSVSAGASFITDMLYTGALGSIPLEIELIRLFGYGGLLLIIIDGLIGDK